MVPCDKGSKYEKVLLFFKIISFFNIAQVNVFSINCLTSVFYWKKIEKIAMLALLCNKKDIVLEYSTSVVLR